MTVEKKKQTKRVQTRVPPRRAAQLPPEERREQLLQCAIKVFAELGIGSAGHAQVAKAAGVAVPTVFAYFPTRIALIQAVTGEAEKYVFDMLRKYTAESPQLSAFERLYGLLSYWAKSTDTHPDLIKVVSNWSTSFQPDVEPLFQDYFSRVIKALAAIVREGQKNGEFGKDVDPLDAALIIQSSGNLISHLKFSKYSSARLTKYLVDVIRGALQTSLSPNAAKGRASPSSRVRPQVAILGK
jgi:TetR/AcrR family transcriptional regulator, hemagglutinin/protease regulatory protein